MIWVEEQIKSFETTPRPPLGLNPKRCGVYAIDSGKYRQISICGEIQMHPLLG